MVSYDASVGRCSNNVECSSQEDLEIICSQSDIFAHKDQR